MKLKVTQNGKFMGYVVSDPHFNSGALFVLDYGVPEDDRICDFQGGGWLFPKFKNATLMGGLHFELVEPELKEQLEEVFNRG